MTSALLVGALPLGSDRILDYLLGLWSGFAGEAKDVFVGVDECE